MGRFPYFLLVGIFLPCVGCYVRTSNTVTVTAEVGVSGPFKSGDKIIDPNLYLGCNLPAPYKVTLWDDAGHELYGQKLPPGKSRFKISVEDGNLLLKSSSEQILATAAISTKENASLQCNVLFPRENRSSKKTTFNLHVDNDPQAPIFTLTVER